MLESLPDGRNPTRNLEPPTHKDLWLEAQGCEVVADWRWSSVHAYLRPGLPKNVGHTHLRVSGLGPCRTPPEAIPG